MVLTLELEPNTIRGITSGFVKQLGKWYSYLSKKNELSKAPITVGNQRNLWKIQWSVLHSLSWRSLNLWCRTKATLSGESFHLLLYYLGVGSMETKVISGIQFSSLPASYIRPEHERPKLSEVMECENVPVIDLGCEDKSLTIKQIGHACQEYGFFQVINHGVSMEAVDRILEVAHEFFSLPVEEKMKLYSDDPSKTMRLSTSFNVKMETVHNWRDYLRLHCYPLDKYVPEWPSLPSSFKDVVSSYCNEVRQLGLRLQEAISESLGLDKDNLKNILGEQGQHMAVNYYPACPEPELTYGLPAHTDPNALTILLQDLHVAGLQVLKNGKWMAIKPHPNAFVINIGDQLQALSNGKYKSVWHRAVVNAAVPRLSVASFLCPCDSSTISAPKSLTSSGEPTIYRDFTYAEYYKKFWSRNLDQEHCLELFKN